LIKLLICLVIENLGYI